MSDPTAIPRPPRLDLLLYLVLITSAIAFLAVCANAHASPMTSMKNDTTSLNTSPTTTLAFLNSGREVASFDRSGLHIISGDLNVRGSRVVTRADVRAILLGETAMAMVGAVVGAAIMFAFCTWTQRFFIARATNAWLRRQQSSARPDAGAYRGD